VKRTFICKNCGEVVVAEGWQINEYSDIIYIATCPKCGCKIVRAESIWEGDKNEE